MQDSCVGTVVTVIFSTRSCELLSALGFGNILNCFAVVGFYGSGKTTTLEMACRKALLENSKRFPCPKMIFLIWDKCEELKKYFEEKFKKIMQQRPMLKRKRCIDVLDLEQACSKYGVVISAGRTICKSNIEVLNELCKRIRQQHSDYSHHFLLVKSHVITSS